MAERPAGGGYGNPIAGCTALVYAAAPPTDATITTGRWNVPHIISDPSFDCVSCGACCFSVNPRYLVLLPEDAGRALPPQSVFEEDGRRYVKFGCGHCVHLKVGGGQAVCGVYEQRPEACRAFRAGSFECVKARRANGIMGEKARAPIAAVQLPAGEDAPAAGRSSR